jgi:hypothetical protein
MASIPLPQFPSDFHPKCYKCSSLNLHFNLTKHPWDWKQLEVQFRCGACGSVGFGEDMIVSRFSGQFQAWQTREKSSSTLPTQNRAEQQAIQLSLRIAETKRKEAEADRLRVLREASEKSAVLEKKALQEAAREIRHQEMIERKRLADRVRKQVKAAAVRVTAAAAASVRVVEPPVVLDEAGQRRLALRERKREVDRQCKARKRAALKAAASAIAAPKEVLPEPAASPLSPESRCAWQPCSNARTKTSKYCSHTCSNRNAREQLRARRAAELSRAKVS